MNEDLEGEWWSWPLNIKELAYPCAVSPELPAAICAWAPDGGADPGDEELIAYLADTWGAAHTPDMTLKVQLMNHRIYVFCSDQDPVNFTSTDWTSLDAWIRAGATP